MEEVSDASLGPGTDNPGGRGGCAVLFLRSNSSSINQEGKCSLFGSVVPRLHCAVFSPLPS